MNVETANMMQGVWTVERFLFLIAGFFVMLSVALGTFVNPWWYAFTAFVGLNLFQSAFTRWCPMMTFLRLAGVKDAADRCAVADKRTPEGT